MLSEKQVIEYNQKVARVVSQWEAMGLGSGGAHSFAKWIGDEWNDPWLLRSKHSVRRFYVDIDQEWVRNLIDRLDGPNCKTLLKVMKIRHDIKKKKAKTRAG